MSNTGVAATSARAVVTVMFAHQGIHRTGLAICLPSFLVPLIRKPLLPLFPTPPKRS